MSSLFTRYVPLDDIRIRSAAQGGDGRTVEAYAAVFNMPSEVSDVDGVYREQIAPTAFAKTLAERSGQIGVFYNHGRSIDGFPSDRFSMPLGTPVEIRPDAKGVLTVTRYNKTPLADEVLESIANGDIRGQSFSGLMIKSTPGRAPRGGYRADRTGSLQLVTRSEIALREYGPTPFPAYEGAGIVGVRATQFLAELFQTPSESRLEFLSKYEGTTPSEPDSSATASAAGGTDEPLSHSTRSLRTHIRAARIVREME